MNLQDAWAKKIMLNQQDRLVDEGFDPQAPFTAEVVDSGEDDHCFMAQIAVKQGDKDHIFWCWEGSNDWATVETWLRMGAQLEREHPGLFREPPSE